eukprot:gb/GFBE01060051.1/.p1 GENE.gb/GFBE01060051.1/~~gb/GFBE01060051.1/.p1  ORF type:complete len:617 (+),score=117.16 gb/GFBE01060051.1/:1-1851(+)
MGKKPPERPPRQRMTKGPMMERVVPQDQVHIPGGLQLADVEDSPRETVQESLQHGHRAHTPQNNAVSICVVDGDAVTRSTSKQQVNGYSPLSSAGFDAEASEIMREMERLSQSHMKEVQDSLSRWITKQARLVQDLKAEFGSNLPGSNSEPEFQAHSPVLHGVVPNSSPSKASTGKHGLMKPGRSKNRRRVGTIFAKDEEFEKTFLQKITEGRAYEYASIVLIVMNSAFIGWQTQHMAERAEQDARLGTPQQTDTPPVFTVLSMMFNVLFTLDLVLRWAAAGLSGFWWTKIDGWSENLSWNILDTIIVLIGFLDMAMLVISLATDGSAESALSEFSVHRVIRIVRVVKVARVIRVMKFFRELRMMVFSIINSSKSLVWVILVLALMFYIFGITFVAGATGYLDTSDKWNDPDNGDLVVFFGTLDRAFVALYMAMSGGNDWVVYYEALALTGNIYHFLFLLFITFAIFAVVNIVTGVFVDSALQSNHVDQAMLIQEELEVKKAKLASMKEVFENLDEDGTGTFTIDEFENRLRDERVQAYFSTLKLDVGDAKALFRLLDYDQSNEITIDEFVEGCSQLQGEARSLDAKIMQFELKFLKEAMCDVTSMLRQLTAADDF